MNTPAPQYPYPHLLEPMTIGGVTFKNRVMAAPMPTERFTDGSGTPTAACLQEYEARARGGVGVVTVAEPLLDFRRAAQPQEPDQGGRETSVYHRERLLLLAECIKSHGAVASVQLDFSPQYHKAGLEASSALSPSDGDITVEALTPADMKAVAESFAQCASGAKASGFQMVTLQGGPGSLLGKCLAPETNHRTDKFGGSLENRARLPLMVIRAVRQAVGPDILVEYRLRGAEIEGQTLADTVAFCQLIQQDVDLLQITGQTLSSAYEPHGSYLPLAQAVKQAVDVPVAAVGGFTNPQQVEQALAQGQCDFVALGRQLLADPDFVKKTAEGRAKEIAPCLRCSCVQALGPDPTARPQAEPFQCAVNPYVMRRGRLQEAPVVLHKQKVLVIGGGVAGMYGAITAAQRGHTVRLVEKSDKLGGRLWFADRDTYKEDLAAFRDSLAARCVSAGVRVVYNTEVNGAYIARYAPDCVLVAIGGQVKKLPIPGLAVFAHHVLWAYEKPELVGRRVVIVGAGLAGVECAMHLGAQEGRQVMVLGRSTQFAPQAYPGQREAVSAFMPQNVTVKSGVTVTEVRPGGVTYRARNGRSVEVEADTVLYALGVEPKQAQALALLKAHPNTRLIGDCRVPGRVLDATRDGLIAAWDIT